MTLFAGDKYWSVRMKSGDIWIHADDAEVSTNGDLIFRTNRDGVFAIGAGQWEYFYAASLLDGGAPCVEHWAHSQHRSTGKGSKYRQSGKKD
jgi:hypothetical protein